MNHYLATVMLPVNSPGLVNLMGMKQSQAIYVLTSFPRVHFTFHANMKSQWAIKCTERIPEVEVDVCGKRDCTKGLLFTDFLF